MQKSISIFNSSSCCNNCLRSLCSKLQGSILKARQLVLVKRDVSSVQREDIVVFCINQSVYIKRIVAVAGDTVQLTDCRVYVNGVYVYPYTCDIDSQIEYHLEEGQYFVLGDNGEASIDSRVFGVISENQLLGKAIAF